MIFQHFLKPKWQHRNPQIRKQALAVLSDKAANTEQIMKNVALNDEESDLRQLAVKRLFDIEMIDKVLDSESDSATKEVAKNRLLQLLSGRVSPSPDVSLRIERVKNTTDEKWLEYIAKHGDDPGLRLAALNKLNREVFFGDIACQDDDAEVRLFAVNKIQRKPTLDRVWKAMKGKDKRVSAIAKERLNLLEAQEQQPQLVKQKAKQICVSLESLARSGEWLRIEIRARQYLQKWQQLQQQWQEANLGAWDQESEQRFQNAQNTIANGLKEFRQRQEEKYAEEVKQDPIRAKKHELVAACEQKLIQIEAEGVTASLCEQLPSEIEQWQITWQDIAKLSPVEENQVRDRFNQVIKDINKFLADFKQQQNYQKNVDDLLLRAEKIQKTKITKKALHNLKKRKEELRAPKIGDKDADKEAKINSILSQLEKKLEQIDQQRQVNKAKIVENIESFIKAVAAGRISRCNDLRKNIQNLLDKLNNEDAALMNQTESVKQYSESLKKFTELVKWRSWANVPIKQQLCEEMEAILTEIHDENLQHDYNTVAQFVKQKRAEWKNIGQSDSRDEQSLWQRFNTACNGIYDKCKQHFHVQSDSRKHSKQIKDGICNDLEKYVAQVNWEQVQWSVVEKIISTAKREWREAGPVDRKYAQILNDRFAKVLDILKGFLGGHREENKDKKEAMLVQAENVAMEINMSKNQDLDIKNAIADIKRLQAAWKSIGKAAKERELWQRFRSFCDAVFNLRDELHEKKDVKLLENVQRKKDICTQLETLLKTEPFDLKQSASEVKKKLEEFEAVGAVPNNEIKELAKHIKQIKKDYSHVTQMAKIRQKQENLKQLRTSAQFCQQIESKLMQGSLEGEMESKVQQWNDLPRLDSRLQVELQQRFDQVCLFAQQSMDKDASELNLSSWQKENTNKKQNLCLKLEILAGVESPAEAQQARMEYQVLQLADKMSGEEQLGRPKQEQEVDEILRQWYVIGLAENDIELAARFDKVLQVAMGQGKE